MRPPKLIGTHNVYYVILSRYSDLSAIDVLLAGQHGPNQVLPLQRAAERHTRQVQQHADLQMRTTAMRAERAASPHPRICPSDLSSRSAQETESTTTTARSCRRPADCDRRCSQRGPTAFPADGSSTHAARQMYARRARTLDGCVYQPQAHDTGCRVTGPAVQFAAGVVGQIQEDQRGQAPVRDTHRKCPDESEADRPR